MQESDLVRTGVELVNEQVLVILGNIVIGTEERLELARALARVPLDHEEDEQFRLRETVENSVGASKLMDLVLVAQDIH